VGGDDGGEAEDAEGGEGDECEEDEGGQGEVLAHDAAGPLGVEDDGGQVGEVFAHEGHVGGLAEVLVIANGIRAGRRPRTANAGTTVTTPPTAGVLAARP